MSISGYFSKNRPEVKMPRTEAWRDGAGIHWDGTIGQGGISVELEQLLIDNQAHDSRDPRQSARPLASDPVLQSHIRTKFRPDQA